MAGNQRPAAKPPTKEQLQQGQAAQSSQEQTSTQSFAKTAEAAPDVEMSQATHPATNGDRPLAIPEHQWSTMQELRANPSKFYDEAKEKVVQELIEEVFFSYDKRKGVSNVI